MCKEHGARTWQGLLSRDDMEVDAVQPWCGSEVQTDHDPYGCIGPECCKAQFLGSIAEK